ncbi:MAG TPA: M20/M25/M40 family metallo-hydrolase [Thermoanaerobaculia bacterium]|nr:M20/M25/M40 family metallo-hydrolase [Thermoanaerobaculia bacterium]
MTRPGWVGAALLCAAAALEACSGKPRLSQIEADLTRTQEEWLREEPVRLLRDYVRIDTTDKLGELDGAEFLRRLLDCGGIETEIVCPAPRRCNLLARLPGRRREGALLLLNHIDVVQVYPELWKDAPPFEGRIRLGFLYGRGAYDMKSLGLAQALALRSLAGQGIVPDSDILFLAEADEEETQRWGSRWLLEHRPEWFTGVSGVLNEGGTNEMILREVRFWGVETLQAGYGQLELESADPALLTALAGRWPKLSAAPVAPHPHVVLGFNMLANHLGHPLTDPLRHLDRVRENPAELAMLPDRYGAFLEPRIFWSPPYVFPPGAKGHFRQYAIVSTPPAVDPVTYLGPIEEDARRHVRVVSASSSGPTIASPYPTPLTEVLRQAIEARYPGVAFGPVPTFGGSTTSIYFRNRGIAAYGFSPLAANITDSSRRHGNDERIFLRDYVDGVNIYSHILRALAVPSGQSGKKTSAPEGQK